MLLTALIFFLQDTVSELEQLADRLQQQRMTAQIKTATIKGAPRQAILKPAHAQYRLPGQTFALGDRVIMVQESGTNGVPFSMKGVVIGVNTTTVDVVWDTPFLGGNNMGGRCSEYRGSSCAFSACLNLTTPQFSVADKRKPPPSVPASARPAPGFPAGQQQQRPNASYFKPAPVRPNPQAGFVIASNPNRAQTAAANGSTSFNNVVQGVRPAQLPAAVAHRTNLQNTLRGGATNGGAVRPPQPFRPPPANAVRQAPPPTGPQATRSALAQPRPSQQVPPPQATSGSAPRPPRGPRGGRGKGKGTGGAPAPTPAA